MEDMAERGDGHVKGFFDRLQWRMAAWMQGRHGADSLSNALIVVGLVLTLASICPGWACFRGWRSSFWP